MVQPKVYSLDQHQISADAINSDALRVITTLQDHGHTAYLVGGGVRDLLAGQIPKDFDISTSARPEEIKAIFRRNCVLIGRRFRLAHIRFGPHILEVSTFRAGDTEDGDLIVRDNTWGDPEEDVLRRDFTMNGLFYDPREQTVIDYVGGCEDIEKRLLRTIGEPDVRFRQDPVRMIRLLKFRARFGFDIDEQAMEGLQRCYREIAKSAPARILEELFRMLESGAAEPFFRLMTEERFLDILLPWLSHFLKGPHAEKVYAYLREIDQANRSSEKGPLPRAVLACCLVWPILEQEIQQQFLDKGREPHLGNVIELTTALLSAITNSSFSCFTRRIRTSMHYILHIQYRLTPFQEGRVKKNRLAAQNEFPYAVQFLKLRASINPEFEKAYDSWAPFAKRPVSSGEQRKKRGRGGRRRRTSSGPS